MHVRFWECKFYIGIIFQNGSVENGVVFKRYPLENPGFAQGNWKTMNILPNGSLMVIYHGTIHKQSP